MFRSLIRYNPGAESGFGFQFSDEPGPGDYELDTSVVDGDNSEDFSNLDEDDSLSGKTFFRLTNLGTESAAITVDIVFLTLEA